MIPKEILKKVRLVEIKTRGLVNEVFSGEYHSVFKGRGIEFAEVREYQVGDDIRTIDWNVTARTGHPHIKIFDEERELVVMFLVDLSGSGEFGTHRQFKREIGAEVCALLAFSAAKNNDKVGLIAFSDRIEKFVPPKKGRGHVFRIIRELLYFTPESRRTHIGQALEYLNRVIRKRCIVFLVSDFWDEGYERPLQILARKHDLIAITLYDPREAELPRAGFVDLKDAESDEVFVVDTSNERLRQRYREEFIRKKLERERLFKSMNVDLITVRTDQSYVQPVVQFFKMRERRFR